MNKLGKALAAGSREKWNMNPKKMIFTGQAAKDIIVARENRMNLNEVTEASRCAL